MEKLWTVFRFSMSIAGATTQKPLSGLIRQFESVLVKALEMKPNPKFDTLKSQLSGSLKSFERKRKNNKTKAFCVYLGATAISAAVTVLLGLQGVPDNKVVYIRNVALILSATVTLLTGFDTFFTIGLFGSAIPRPSLNFGAFKPK